MLIGIHYLLVRHNVMHRVSVALLLIVPEGQHKWHEQLVKHNYYIKYSQDHIITTRLKTNWMKIIQENKPVLKRKYSNRPTSMPSANENCCRGSKQIVLPAVLSLIKIKMQEFKYLSTTKRLSTLCKPGHY